MDDDKITAAILSLGMFLKSRNVDDDPTFDQLFGFYRETLAELKSRKAGLEEYQSLEEYQARKKYQSLKKE